MDQSGQKRTPKASLVRHGTAEADMWREKCEEHAVSIQMLSHNISPLVKTKALLQASKIKWK